MKYKGGNLLGGDVLNLNQQFNIVFARSQKHKPEMNGAGRNTYGVVSRISLTTRMFPVG